MAARYRWRTTAGALRYTGRMDDMQTTSPASGSAAVPSSAPEPTAPAPTFDDAPIGVFDSGFGGLTVAREIAKELPRESIVYLGDSARCPYGPRSLDEVDGFVPQTLGKYQEKELKSITAGDLGLETEEEKKAAEEKSEKSKQTLDFVKKTLGDKVKDVRLSDNLGSHPVSVVPAEGMTFEMEKYFKRVDPNSGMKADRILEFNADHPIFAKLQIAVAQDEKKAEDLVKILYTQALLMADLPVENAGEYTDLVCSLIG